MRWFWKWYLRRNHWEVEGSFPYHIPRMIIAVAPHTHWMDFVVGVAIRSVGSFEYVKFLGKAELFEPPFGFIFRLLGGTPVDRSRSTHLVEAVVQEMNESERLVLALSPEGTRKRVTRLRTGFYHIARQANVPILLGGLDYGRRRIVFSEPFYPTQNEEADLNYIIRFFAPLKGKVPENGLAGLLKKE
jgi:1-acyl-sn-glycerol-3-phosphate acyltransferase